MRVALPLGSYQVVACDLLDKLDEALAQRWLLYPHESPNEREPVGRGEEVGHRFILRHTPDCGMF
jgi:hypothetical protein